MRDTLGVGTCSFSRFSHSHFPDLSRHGLHYGAKSVARALSFARGGGDIKGGLALVAMAVRRPCARVGSGDVSLAAARESPPLPSSRSEGISSLLCVPRLAVCSISVRSFYPECPSAQLAPPDRFGRASRGLLGTPGPAGYCFVGLRYLGIWVSRVSRGHQATSRKRLPHNTPLGCPQCVDIAFPNCSELQTKEVPRTLSGSRTQHAKKPVSRLRPVTLEVTVSGEVRGF